MRTVCLHDKATIERFLRRNAPLHVYGLGDLDDHFWSATTWYALEGERGVAALALLYTGLAVPVLLALGGEDEPLADLLRSVSHALPAGFDAHLSPSLAPVLAEHFSLEFSDHHHRMALVDASRLDGHSAEGLVTLSKGDLDELLAFYRTHYPHGWFEPRMLETHHYYGIRGPEGLLSVAGVQVYSPRYGVAAVGNIATRQDQRGKGYAKAVVSALCKDLLHSVDTVALGVSAANAPAIACYNALGFEIVAPYDLCRVRIK